MTIITFPSVKQSFQELVFEWVGVESDCYILYSSSLSRYFSRFEAHYTLDVFNDSEEEISPVRKSDNFNFNLKLK